MILRRLGPDAPWVYPIGFGAMALSLRTRPTEHEALAVLHAVFDRGVTLVDSADVYCLDEQEVGHNERLIAKAIRTWGGPRDGIVVATKGGLTRSGAGLLRTGHPAHLKQACERSLRALGVDVIDLYQLHAPDPVIPFSDSVGALAELRRDGKVRWIGLSNVTVVEIEAARAIAPIQAVQNALSLFRRDSGQVGPVARLERWGPRGVRYRLRWLFREPVQSGVLQHCERLGLGLLAYSPLGGGHHEELPRQAVLGGIARARGVSVHAVAIAWVLAQGRAVIPIPSARTVAHASDSISAVELALTPGELAALEAVDLERTA